MMKALTVVETAKIDQLRLRLAALGYPMPDVPAEAIMAAVIQLKKAGELAELSLEDIAEPSKN